ncbi:MAG: FAD-dependent oxidoreductase [Polyangiales bacterium]
MAFAASSARQSAPAASERRISTFPTPPPPAPLVLGLPGFTFADLFDPEALARLHAAFMDWLAERDADVAGRLRAWQAAPDAATSAETSAHLLALAPHLGAFVAQLFGVEDALGALRAARQADDVLFEFRKHFAKRRVLAPNAGRHWSHGAAAATAIYRALCTAAAGEGWQADEERAAACAVMALVDAEKVLKRGADSASCPALAQLPAALEAAALPALAQPAAQLETALLACEAHLAGRFQAGDTALKTWASLFVPHKQDFQDLVELRRPKAELSECSEGPEQARRQRSEPFALTDNRATPRQVAREVDYCIFCHPRDKDSCSKGLRDKQGQVQKNALGVELKGCPLDEKISEMHLLRRDGHYIGALATVIVDNPMVPGTGHRICNDCMKACIYQAQQPVDIPQVETRALTDVLALPWGFEIYSLLTRWNPLNVRRPYALPYNGKKVMVVGLGPAGYTLAHYLVNEGFGVVGVDGLKLEPMPIDLVGSREAPPKPVYDYTSLQQPLESRTLLGFGGVSEYGITVRWDKNFLALMYLNLLRRRSFRAYGGIRFGGTLTLDDAWQLGIDHVAIAAGAGKPTQIPMRGNLLRGIRKASDFLMGLQLTGAYKRDSLANLQVRLPALVVGGGLTAIDTATELSAYYIVQSERTLARYEALAAVHGEKTLRARFDAEELVVLDEAVAHGREIRSERAAAAQARREPDLQRLIRGWGGVSIVYRRRLADAPAYRLNHEEVSKCLEEGVRFIELHSPIEAHPDAHGALEALTCARLAQQIDADGKRRLVETGAQTRLPARTLFVAAGTHPNTSYEKEYPDTFALDARGYLENHHAAVDAAGQIHLSLSGDGSGFFTSYLKEGHTVSYYGDNHPRYAGNVVKAMASAKHGHRAVRALYEALGLPSASDGQQAARDAEWRSFAKTLNRELLAEVEDVRRLADDIVEVVVRAPMAARKFEPGQFYRFQNYEAYAPRVNGVPWLMEGLALTGAWVDRKQGLLSMIALEMGTSSRMCAALKKGEPVLVMGPTGAPTEIPEGETVLLAGGGLGNAVLFSIAKAMKDHGCRVIYFAGYKRGESLFKQDEVEAATDQVIWSTDSGAHITPRRPQDHHIRANIIEAMLAYQKGELGEKRIDLREVDRIIAIGSDRMMAAIKAARHGVLAPHLKPAHKAIGSINSPMQCMLKAVCAQCLQKVVDPETGETRMIYTCFNQDQELDRVDFPHLAARLRQNSVQEKLANLSFAEMLRRGTEQGVLHLV